MIKHFIFLLFILATSHSISGQICSQLTNGTYVTEFDSSFKNYPKSHFKVKDNKYYLIKKNKREKYEIIKLDKCSFRLKKKLLDTTGFTEFQKLLSRQQPYFDIYKVEGNFYYFVFRVNLHTQSYSGRFLRIKD